VNLAKIDGKEPSAFASIKSEEDFEDKIAAKSTTTVVPRTCNPQWVRVNPIVPIK